MLGIGVSQGRQAKNTEFQAKPANGPYKISAKRSLFSSIYKKPQEPITPPSALRTTTFDERGLPPGA
jgi:hypothetical protein